MREPYRSQFAQLIRLGAASRDVHDSEGQGSYDSDGGGEASDRFVERELGRVMLHSRSLCAPLVARIGRAARILDVGCGTGGSTVALAMCGLHAKEVVGIDANPRVLPAALVRACGHGLQDEVRFVHVPAGHPFPFEDGHFDLVTCVSVLEFITNNKGRKAFVDEMLRVLRPGGYLYLATPSPLRLREYHSRRLLGDLRRSPGYPWSSSAGTLRAMLGECEIESLAPERIRQHPRLRHVSWAAPMLAWALPWQRVLARKPSPVTGARPPRLH